MQVRTDIWLVCFVSLLTFWQASQIHRWQITNLLVVDTILYSDAAWCFELLLNLYGYGIVFCTIYCLYLYYLMMDDYNYNEDIASYLFFVLFGWVPEDWNLCKRDSSLVTSQTWEKVASKPRQRLELISHSSALLAAYIAHGLILEKIMTQVYEMPDKSYERFADSQFLVYMTCTAAGFASLTQLFLSKTQIITRALFKYHRVSVVYIVSVWCQYEALKFVGFPTVVLSTSFQILRKGSKTVRDQWLTALLLSVGFLWYLFNSSVQAISLVVAISGVTLLLLYLLCDSYISVWQRKMLRQNQVTTPVQMMFALNFFSCLLTGGAVIQYPKTDEAIAVMKHPVFIVDCALLMISMAGGQLLVYRTIEKFGHEVFTEIMILRQMVSILLSCAVYGHWATWRGCVGAALVYLTVVAHTHRDQKRRVFNKHCWI